MKTNLFAAGLLLAGCASTADDPVYEQARWMKSDEYLACKNELDKDLAKYKSDAAAYEAKKKAASNNYNEAAEMEKYNQQLKEYEAAKAAGKIAVMPIIPLGKDLAVMSSIGVGPKLVNVARCHKPPEGWSAE